MSDTSISTTPQLTGGIHSWSEDSRPRERLLRAGASSLSNAELLAILIGSGSARCNAVELMNQVLTAADNSLDRLGGMTYRQLLSFKGIGPAKAITILAALELGRRRMKRDRTDRLQLNSSQKIFNEILRPIYWDKTEEESWALYLDQGLHLVATECIGKGGLTAVNTDIRLILRKALEVNATAVVLSHNHPSGTVTPSTTDDKLTHDLAQACRLMQVRLVDHLIVHADRYFSYAEQGRL